MNRLRTLGIVLGTFAVLCILITLRVRYHPQWLLTPQDNMGDVWRVAEMPLSSDTLLILGQPNTLGREYRSPLDEKVYLQCITPATFDAYREPPQFLGGHVTAQRQLDILGPDKPLRAWVIKANGNNTRFLVYAWLQNPEGQTRLFGIRDMQPGLLDRIQIGSRLVTDGSPWCIVRLYTQLLPMDRDGAQARRNLDEIAKAIHSAGTKGAGKS